MTAPGPHRQVGQLSDLEMAALELARDRLPPAIVNHSLRVHWHACRAQQEWAVTDVDPQELFVACVLHDLGCVLDAPSRFEVTGADAAAEFLSARGMSEQACARVWHAVALHTSAGIAERMATLVRLTRAGVTRDFARERGPEHGTIETRLPRLDVEVVLGDAVVAQALTQPSRAPASTWPGGLVAAHLADPSRAGVNRAF